MKVAHVLAALSACFLAAPVAFADDASYSNPDYGIELKCPEGWKVQAEKGEGLADLVYKDEEMTALIDHTDVDAKKTVVELADEEEGSYKEEAKKYKRTKEEKLVRKTGEWLLREFTYSTEDEGKQYCRTLFVKNGAHLVALKLASGEKLEGASADAAKALFLAFTVKGEKGADAGAKAEGAPKAEGGKGTEAAGSVPHPWARWAPGTWAELKIASVSAGTETEMTQKTTLSSKSDDELVLKVEGKLSKPAVMDMPATEQKVAAKSGAPASGAGGSAPKELGKGEETLDVGGKKIACKWSEYEIEAGGKKMTSKVWTSDEVPGGVVKSVTKGESLDSTITLIGFEIKK